MTHARLKALTVLGVVLVSSAVTVPSASADPIPPPSGITISVGHDPDDDCRGESVRVLLPLTGFTITYADYQARAGGSTSPADRRKKCRMNLGVHVPQGYTFAVDRVEYRGTADVASGATGYLKARHYFQTPGWRVPVIHQVPGPNTGPWSFTNEPLPNQLDFRTCGQDHTLYLESELSVEPGTSDPSRTSFMAGNRSDYRLTWKTCP